MGGDLRIVKTNTKFVYDQGWLSRAVITISYFLNLLLSYSGDSSRSSWPLIDNSTFFLYIPLSSSLCSPCRFASMAQHFYLPLRNLNTPVNIFNTSILQYTKYITFLCLHHCSRWTVLPNCTVKGREQYVPPPNTPLAWGWF